ncbi:hypothetical protein Bbelb_294860 [Branchiostoma belcheri]|nr:hypothetical protein Bbelb_294860 [Branchiostoma belcheri]
MRESIKIVHVREFEARREDSRSSIDTAVCKPKCEGNDGAKNVQVDHLVLGYPLVLRSRTKTTAQGQKGGQCRNKGCCQHFRCLADNQVIVIIPAGDALGRQRRLD